METASRIHGRETREVIGLRDELRIDAELRGNQMYFLFLFGRVVELFSDDDLAQALSVAHRVRQRSRSRSRSRCQSRGRRFRRDRLRWGRRKGAGFLTAGNR